MTTQPDMFTVPVPDKEDAKILFNVLKGRGWQHAAALVTLLNTYFPSQWTDRRVRDAANEADGMIVSGPGSKGYVRVDEVVLSLALGIAQTKISQAKKMMRSGIQIKRMAHAYAIRDAMDDAKMEKEIGHV
jgi:hypothetical protein